MLTPQDCQTRSKNSSVFDHFAGLMLNWLMACFGKILVKSGKIKENILEYSCLFQKVVYTLKKTVFNK